MNKLTISLLVLFPLTANALSVDSMLLVGDGKGNSTFTLTNSMGYTEFIKAQITKYETNWDTIIETPYTEENIQDWEVTLTHPKLILENGRTKAVGVRSLCSRDCNFDTDHVYKVHFIPEPYSEDGSETPSVAMTIGYAPLYIIPAANPQYKFTVRNTGTGFYVENTGNTFVTIGIDNCEEGQTLADECRMSVTVLANRAREYDIYKGLKNKNLEMYAINHDQTFYKKFTISPGETYKEE